MKRFIMALITLLVCMTSSAQFKSVEELQKSGIPMVTVIDVKETTVDALNNDETLYFKVKATTVYYDNSTCETSITSVWDFENLKWYKVSWRVYFATRNSKYTYCFSHNDEWYYFNLSI